MFVLRAMFWFTVVGVLMPQTPGTLGGGTGGDTGSAIVQTLQTSALIHLSRVRAELEARHMRDS